MDKQKSSKKGSLKISEEVIATIAASAALEIDGVEELAPAKSSLKNVFIKPKQGNIIIAPMGDVVEISIGIVVKNGCKIAKVCEELQHNVKESVQGMTGITVSRVNVIVSAVSFDE